MHFTEEISKFIYFIAKVPFHLVNLFTSVFEIYHFKYIFTLNRAALMHVEVILVVPLLLLTETRYRNWLV